MRRGAGLDEGSFVQPHARKSSRSPSRRPTNCLSQTNCLSRTKSRLREEPVAVRRARRSRKSLSQTIETVVVAEPAAAASVEAEPAAEPWDAAPAMPPAPVAEAPVASVPLPMPSEVVHPPVATADLLQIVGEDAPKVPFWKKELSLGGKKGDKPVKKRKQKAPPVSVVCRRGRPAAARRRGRPEGSVLEEGDRRQEARQARQGTEAGGPAEMSSRRSPRPTCRRSSARTPRRCRSGRRRSAARRPTSLSRSASRRPRR